MKTVILILSLSPLLTFGQPTAADFKKLEWLEGIWNRTNAKPGKTGTERWVKVSATEWRGWGVSMTGSDTAFVEKLRLAIKDNSIYYVADVPENKSEVFFKFSVLNESQFTCENPLHDFPKKIEYTRNGNKLHAVVSGNGKSIEYWFEKK